MGMVVHLTSVSQEGVDWELGVVATIFLATGVSSELMSQRPLRFDGGAFADSPLDCCTGFRVPSRAFSRSFFRNYNMNTVNNL